MSVSGGSGGYSRLPAGTVFSAIGGSVSAAAQHGNQNVRAYPVFCPYPITLTQLGVEVTVVGDAGSTFTPAVWNDDGTGQPGTLVGAGAAVPGDVAAVNLGAAAFTVPYGWTWWGSLLLGVTVTQPTVRTMNSPGGQSPLGGSLFRGSGPSVPFALRAGQAAIPSPFGAVANGGNTTVIIGKT